MKLVSFLTTIYRIKLNLTLILQKDNIIHATIETPLTSLVDYSVTLANEIKIYKLFHSLVMKQDDC